MMFVGSDFGAMVTIPVIRESERIGSANLVAFGTDTSRRLFILSSAYHHPSGER